MPEITTPKPVAPTAPTIFHRVSTLAKSPARPDNPSASTLWRAIKRGELHAIRFGTAVRISAEAWADYLRGHATEAR